MKGICVAVKATTSELGSSRYAVLKLWKSRPAAPMIRTRRAMEDASPFSQVRARGPGPPRVRGAARERQKTGSEGREEGPGNGRETGTLVQAGTGHARLRASWSLTGRPSSSR